jgi:hypothetical protein
MKRHLLRGAAALLAMTVVVGACDSAGPSATGVPRVSIMLTDAPGDIAEAIIVIDQVSLIGHGETGVVVLRSTPWEGDLLELRNTFATLVDDEAVPVGRYDQVRLRIPQGCIRTNDGRVFATMGYTACGAATGRLQMPSFAASGLKIKLPPEAEVTSEDRRILLDFIVGESFGRERGNSNMWVMHPVVRATEFTLSSNVHVTVGLADGVALPAGVELKDFGVALNGSPALALGEDGKLLLRFLVPGEQSLVIVPPEGWVITTAPAVPYVFDLGSNADLDLSFSITGIQAAPPPAP